LTHPGELRIARPIEMLDLVLDLFRAGRQVGDGQDDQRAGGKSYQNPHLSGRPVAARGFVRHDEIRFSRRAYPEIEREKECLGEREKREG
jgi:hypothetical protein